MQNALAMFFVVGATMLSGCAVFFRDTTRVPLREAETLEPASGIVAEPRITDTDIELAVRRELYRDPGVSGPEVDVAVENGIVSLTGTVNNGLASLRAVESAETVRGVRAVVNRLRVVAPRVGDAELERVIRLELSDDPVIELEHLELGVKDGRVRLSGAVDSFTEKQAAERLVVSVPGVASVENEIRVVAQARNDAEIAADIERRFLIDAHLDDETLRVAVHDGSVAVVGQVGTPLEWRRVYSNAWVTGVRAVDTSRVIIEPWRHDRYQRQVEPFTTDDEIRRAVRDALRFDPRVWDVPISVAVRGATVVLSGVVPNWIARRAAEDDALNTVGVWRVENRLVVRPEMPRNDAELERRVREKLAMYPADERESIAARVDSGVVVLEGSVGSRYDSLQLERVVGGVPGVLEVRNELRVLAPFASLRDDAMLEREIESELWWDPRVDPEDVEVEVRNGIAIVTGIVSSRQEYDAVIENVLEARPRGIENHLRRPLAPVPR